MDRILCESLRKHIMGADEAAALIVPGSTVGLSGFTESGYPKLVPLALAARIEAMKAYTEVIQNGMLDLLDSGKLRMTTVRQVRTLGADTMKDF